MQTILTIHTISASLFLLDFIVKTILLISNKEQSLANYKKATKVISMIISTAFLLTGIYLLVKIGMKNVGGWFHLKLTLVLIGLALGIIGFKRNKKWMAITALIIFLYVYGLSETKDIKMGAGKPAMSDVVTDTAAANYDMIAHGKQIYVIECMRCHGEKGNAGISGAVDLTGSVCENRGLIGTIKHGRNAMPAYKDILDEQEIKVVAEYVKTLRKKE